MQARHTASEHGQRIILRAPRPQFLRLLKVTGVGGPFPISGT
ncbi:hypothetical protein ABZ667_43825 [Streptomyces lavendulae]